MEYVATVIGLTLFGYFVWYANRAVRLGLTDQQWQVYCELKQMSERELTDIGLTRGDIYNVAKGTKE